MKDTLLMVLITILQVTRCGWEKNKEILEKLIKEKKEIPEMADFYELIESGDVYE